MADSGHASAFSRYIGVDDFAAVTASEFPQRICNLIFKWDTSRIIRWRTALVRENSPWGCPGAAGKLWCREEIQASVGRVVP